MARNRRFPASIPMDPIAELHRTMAAHCAAIERYFKPGAMVTIYVRNPDTDDADALVTRDSPDKIIAGLQALVTGETTKRRLFPET